MDKDKIRPGERETRTIHFAEFRVVAGADGAQPKIAGYAAIFNTKTTIQSMWGDFQERIAPGAFKNALQTSDVRGLFNHDPNLVLGRMKSGTLTATEDDKGLQYEITPPDTQWARDFLETLRRGDVDQSSFAFTVKTARWDQEDGMEVRTILEVEYLYDVSPVTYPAYEDTEAAARSLEQYRKTRDGPPVAETPSEAWRLDIMRRRLELAARE